MHTENFFDRLLHAKFSLTGRFIQHFLWKGHVYNIFFEWVVIYRINIASAFVWKKIYICPFSRCLSRYSPCRKSRSFQEIFLCSARIQESQELFPGLCVRVDHLAGHVFVFVVACLCCSMMLWSGMACEENKWYETLQDQTYICSK